MVAGVYTGQADDDHLLWHAMIGFVHWTILCCNFPQSMPMIGKPESKGFNHFSVSKTRRQVEQTQL